MRASDFDFELPDELIAQEPPARRGESRLLVVRRDRDRFEHTVFTCLPELLVRGDLLVLNNTRVFPARLIGKRVPTGGTVECLLLRQLPDQNPRPPTLTAGKRAGTSDSELKSEALDVGPPVHRAPTPREPAGTARQEVGRWEVDVGNRRSSSSWEALMHPGQKLKPGARVVFERGNARLSGEVLARHFYGRRTIRLWTDGTLDVAAAIDRIGHMPLPPYIRRDDAPTDRERYQTVFARARGSVAAPTAGLHFTPELLDALDARGVERVEVTLHVGYGTFKPVRTEQVEDHVVDAETFTVSQGAADAITRARQDGRRIIAVGTTTTRTLESLSEGDDGRIAAASGETQLFIRPGHEFRIVRGLITNFHLPRSSLLMLVAAFAGRERVLEAYREAVAQRYRFYSYGDAMLLL